MSVPYRTASLSDLLTNTCSLIGVDVGDLQQTETTMLVNFFNRGLRRAWESNIWTDLCPVGEVRFPNNLLTYPNDLTQSTYWTLANLTATQNALVDPMDNRTTATGLLETAVSGVHSFAQNAAMLPNQIYTFSGYVRPNGRNYIQAVVNGGVYTFSAFFSLAQPTPTVGTISYTAGANAPQASISQSGNGFFFWAFTVNTANTMTPGAGTVTVNLSPDGSTTSYLGIVSDGCYSWGVTCNLMQDIVPASWFVSYTQPGETAIEAIFKIDATDPSGGFVPPLVNYNLTPNGAVIIGPSSIGPVFLTYRPQRPVLSASAFSSSVSYTSGVSFNYTSTVGATSGITQCYAVTSGFSAGAATPDTQPTYFQQVYIPYVFSSYLMWSAYADWLLAEGQAAKAQAAMATAQTFLDDENDKQERQNGNIMPWRVNTHLTSQDRGMGFVNQNYLPAGTFYIS